MGWSLATPCNTGLATAPPGSLSEVQNLGFLLELLNHPSRAHWSLGKFVCRAQSIDLKSGNLIPAST